MIRIGICAASREHHGSDICASSKLAIQPKQLTGREKLPELWVSFSADLGVGHVSVGHRQFRKHELVLVLDKELCRPFHVDEE